MLYLSNGVIRLQRHKNNNCSSAAIGYDSEFLMKERKQGNFKECFQG